MFAKLDFKKRWDWREASPFFYHLISRNYDKKMKNGLYKININKMGSNLIVHCSLIKKKSEASPFEIYQNISFLKSFDRIYFILRLPYETRFPNNRLIIRISISHYSILMRRPQNKRIRDNIGKPRKYEGIYGPINPKIYIQNRNKDQNILIS